MRKTCLAALILTTVSVAGCAYAPSGTLVEALEPEGSSRATFQTRLPRAAGTAGAAGQLADETSGPIETLPPPTAYGPTGEPVVAVPGEAGPLAQGGQGPRRDAHGLLTSDEADATRAWLQEIARNRSTGVRPRGSTSASQLRELRETHGARAISEIEADAAD